MLCIQIGRKIEMRTIQLHAPLILLLWCHALKWLTLTFPVDFKVGISSLSHHHWILEAKEPRGLLGIHPTQIQAPANLVREVLQTSMRDAVIEQEHTTKGYLAGHYSFLKVHSTCLFNLLSLSLDIPGGTSTANMLGCCSTLLSSRHHL